MIELSFGEIANLVNGKLIGLAESDRTSAAPIIDSRLAAKGKFFAAFNGAQVDGHDFAKQAIDDGCEFVLASKDLGLPSILVADVQEALTTLATYVRSKLKALTVIGITGSQGKTTTKDLLAHILAISGKTIAPEASLNNELGVPLLILQCDEQTKYCIVEMGARHKGDIAHLVSIAKPSIGLVLSVGTAHLGEFGSREVIAKTKQELILGLDAGSSAILGSYDEFTPHMAEGLDLKVLTFGQKPNCEVRAADLELREGRAHFDLVTPAGRATVSLQLLGIHQVANALAAAAVATALNLPIESIAAALSTAEQKSRWRMELSNIGGVLLINDSYNANPESMAAALHTLALLTQERGGVSWAFLGKMHELGASATKEHEEIGRLASEIGIDHLISIGTEDYLTAVRSDLENEGEVELHHFPTLDSAQSLFTHIGGGDVVLVKASRAEGFELLAQELTSYLSSDQLTQAKDMGSAN
jgi:UDP-N-acetylmuramoyl-tripeptide--D-alanyl-D-alanine ligase